MSRPEPKSRFISVETKLALVTVLVLATLSCVLFGEMTRREQRHLVDAKSVVAAMATELFAASCQTPLARGDHGAIAAELDKLRSNRAIAYAAVYSSAEGRTISEYNPQRSAPFDFQRGRPALPSLASPEGIEVLRSIHAPGGVPLGFAFLRFSLADENAVYQADRRALNWFAVSLTLAMAALLWLWARLTIVKPLSLLTESARKFQQGDREAGAAVRSHDELGHLALVLNRMGGALVDREHELAQAKKNLQTIFDNTQQAFFTVGPDLRISDEVSPCANLIFGDVLMVGQPVWDFLRLDSFPDAPALGRMKFFLDQIYGCDDLQWDLCEHERIRQLDYLRTHADGTTEERVLQLDYVPIYKDEAIVKIMFLVRDVTEQHHLQAEVARLEQQSKETLVRVRQIAALEPGAFRSFLSEANAILDSCEHSLHDLEDPKRAGAAFDSLLLGLHTLDGHARKLKLIALQRLAHATEDFFQMVRDGELGLNAEGVASAHDRIGEVRELLSEFGKLGRQILGAEPESPAEKALAFLRTPEAPFAEWQVDIENLGEACGEDARLRLLAHAFKMQGEALAHGFVSITAGFEAVLNELQKVDVLAPQVRPHLQNATNALLNTRSLAGEVGKAELWPYFVDEAKVLLGLLTRKLAERAVGGSPEGGHEATEVILFAAAARSFGLPTLAKLATEYHHAMTKEGLDAGVVLKVLEAWLADARTLYEMASRPETEVDLLGRFHQDAGDLMDRLRAAAPDQVPGLVTAAVACARRYRFRLVQAAMEELVESHPTDGPGVAEIVSQHVAAYEDIRREMRDNEKAEHPLLVMPIGACKREAALEDWLASAHEAGLCHLSKHAHSLPISGRILLMQDIRRFDVLIPATRGSKTRQSTQRVS